MPEPRKQVNRFPKSARLLSSPQFRQVFNQKQSVSNDVLILYAVKNNQPHSRLGMAVSRKVGNAVVRNAWKRRIREAFRLQQHDLPMGFDFVVLPRRGVQPDAGKIRSSLLSLSQRLAKRATQAKPIKKRRYGRGKS